MTRDYKRGWFRISVLLTLLPAASLSGGLARADYLAPDPGTRISIQYNFNGVIVVRPVGGVWTHPLCPDVRGAVLSRTHFRRELGDTNAEFDTVRELLVQAAMNGR